MKEEILVLKNAVDEVAKSLCVEVYELCMEEGTDVYKAFGKKHGQLASEVYKDLLYQGVDLRVSIVGVMARCRDCSGNLESVEFWEDLNIIVCLVEALEVSEYFKQSSVATPYLKNLTEAKRVI